MKNAKLSQLLTSELSPGQIKLKGAKGAKYKVQALALSSDARYALFGSLYSAPEFSGYRGVVSLLELASGKIVQQVEINETHINLVACSPDQKYFLASGMSGTVLCHLETGDKVREFTDQPNDHIYGVGFSSDNKYIAVNRVDDGPFYLLDIETWREVRDFHGHTKRAKCFAFSSDNRELLSGGSDKTIRLWDVATGAELQIFNGD